MRRTTITVIAVAIVAILVIAAVVLSSQKADDKSSVLIDNGNGAQASGGENNSTQNVTATSPATVNAADEHFSLSASYEGIGDASHTYDWNKTYDLSIVSTSSGSWSGRVAILAFVDKVGENIGPNCMVLKNAGQAVSWGLIDNKGWTVAYGHVLVWTTNGSSQYDQKISISFNTTGTGTYDLTFQAFDADSGKAISQPLNLAPMIVPATGTLKIEGVGHGSFTDIGGISYYEIVLNVTNGWNVVHNVALQNLTIWVDGQAVKADSSQTAFTTQDLDPGQLTQFQVFFPIAMTDSALKLTYTDGGSTIEVLLS